MAARKRRKARKSEPAASLNDLRHELESVKNLLMLLLAKLGAESKEIALPLGISHSAVRKLLPMRKIVKIVKAQE